MAILKAVNVKVGRNTSLKGIINYVLQPKKTEEQLSTGFCCDVPNALETFNDTKDFFGKMRGVNIITSFSRSLRMKTYRLKKLTKLHLDSQKSVRSSGDLR